MHNSISTSPNHPPPNSWLFKSFIPTASTGASVLLNLTDSIKQPWRLQSCVRSCVCVHVWTCAYLCITCFSSLWFLGKPPLGYWLDSAWTNGHPLQCDINTTTLSFSLMFCSLNDMTWCSWLTCSSINTMQCSILHIDSTDTFLKQDFYKLLMDSLIF